MTSVSGKRGIGKTYHLSKEAYKRYKQKFFIITNFTHLYAHIDCSKDDPGVLYDIIRELGVFKERGFELVDLDPRFIHSGVFIGIDEAHLYFSADLYKRYQDDEQFQYVLKFLAQARKSDVEIWYSSQDPAKIDKNWRRYTEDWIRYVPVIPLYKKKNILVQRSRRKDGTIPLPYYRREIRYPIPLIWEEHHKLDHENPVFDYSMMRGEDGRYHLSPHSTLMGRKIVRSGWLDPFPYKLYDSYQMLAMQGDPQEKDFEKLLKFGYIEHTFQKENFPTFKNIVKAKRKDSDLPVRYIRDRISLPEPEGSVFASENQLKQPIEFLDDLAFFNHLKKSSSVPKYFRNYLRKQAASPSGGGLRSAKEEDENYTDDDDRVTGE